MSRGRGSSRPMNLRPAMVNRSRLDTRKAATNRMISTLANSPGWIETGPMMIHSFAPATQEMLHGSTPGSTSSTRPARPKV
jgi:hypothetical protein